MYVDMLDTFTNEDRGQVGIGTIIVFIAMVLVVAIAAGVLITTAGELQEQAAQTGSETEDQVSNLVELDGVIGETPTALNEITTLKATHSLASGSDPVDVQDLTWTIEVNGDTEVYNYNDVSDADPNGNALTEVTDNIQQGSLLVNQEDRIQVKFDLDGNSNSFTESFSGDNGDNGGNNDPNIDQDEQVTLSNADDVSSLDQVVHDANNDGNFDDVGGGDADVTSDFEIVDEDAGTIQYTGSTTLSGGTGDTIQVDYTQTVGGLDGVGTLDSDTSFSVTVNSPAGGERYFGTTTPNYIDAGEASYRMK